MKENGREHFASRLGFILVSAGCAVGLGNVWKFPYICGNNGGAIFIIIYLICLAALGFPILVCEFTIGRGSKASIGRAFSILSPKVKRWSRFRYFGFAGNYLLMAFYSMVAGWMIYYLVRMLSGSMSDMAPEAVAGEFENLLASPGILILFTMIVVVACIGVCALGLQKGVEKVSKIMMIALIVLMVIMAIRSVTLHGSGEGLKFYLMPDLDRAMERGFGNIIFDAMTHAFFTLSVGIGSMEILGSFMTDDRTMTGESTIVICLDTLIALMAGVIIIPACFSYGISPDAGPSLIFITLPNVFNNMAGGRIFGTLFFIFMSFAALSTVIAVYQNIISISEDLFGISKKKSLIINMFGIAAASIPAILGFNLLSNVNLLGEGSTIMDLEDFLVSYNLLPLGALVFVLFAVRKNGWGFDNFIKEADKGTGPRFPRKLGFYMSYILPAIILLIYFKGYYDMFKTKDTPVFIAWMIVAVAIAAFIMFIAHGKPKKETA
ncbi:MAG: sodium-dependent transporter [Eubacterium sp.]|nr:sodium-dependent transporter [Eubacterium sp.]